MAKLTKSLVEALEPSKDGVKGSYLFAWDQELRGFGVQVLPSGLKSFILQYRNGEKRSRRIVIGRYGVMTVEEARKEARVLLGKIAKGVDPADEKPPEGRHHDHRGDLRLVCVRGRGGDGSLAKSAGRSNRQR